MAGLRSMLDDSWAVLRRPMTSGQRQSALLLVPLIIALVLYGRPAEGPFGAGLVAAPAPPGSPAPVSDLSDPPTTAGSPSASPPPAAQSAGLPSTDAPATQPPPGPPAVAAPVPATVPEVPGIVAVVRPPADGEAAGDADIATAFLRHRGIDAATVVLDPDTDVCASVLARGSVVLAGIGLGPTLRTCLVDGGAVVIAYDSLGDLPPAGPGAGEVLSTRRGVVDGLDELARWAVGADQLVGSTGLVTMESARDQIAIALPLLADAGVDVTTVVYLPDDDPTVAISRGVIELATAGVDDTLFVAPVSVQRDWVRQSAVVSPAMGYVVADAFDALIEAGYADGFDGAVAQTTLQFPWSDEPAPARAQCDRIWADVGGGELPPSAAVRMYAWCQHTELASRTGAGGIGAAALRATTLDSPLTTSLGPMAGNRWGPSQAVVTRWRAACTCWAADGPTTDRKPRSR